jgi:hypothetical protein
MSRIPPHIAITYQPKLAKPTARDRARATLAAQPANASPPLEPRGCPTPGACSCPTAPIVPPELIRALELAETGLSDIGDADREPGDDLAWAEARAARDLPRIRQALNLWRDQVAAVAPVAVAERPWEREGWCDAQGRCWRFDPCENGWWSYGDPTDLMGSPRPWTHMAPHWAIPLPATTPQEPQP